MARELRIGLPEQMVTNRGKRDRQGRKGRKQLHTFLP